MVAVLRTCLPVGGKATLSEALRTQDWSGYLRSILPVPLAAAVGSSSTHCVRTFFAVGTLHAGAVSVLDDERLHALVGENDAAMRLDQARERA